MSKGYETYQGLIRVKMDWWDNQRATHEVSAGDLKYMNNITLTKVICPRVIYVKNTERARAILSRLDKE